MNWFTTPLGAGGVHRATVPGCRKVLVIVPSVVAGTRLLDLLPLLDSDFRIQVYFTLPEPCGSTTRFLSAIGGLVIPWEMALQHEFDLVLAASYRFIDRAPGPVLVLPHGASAMKSRQRVRAAGEGARPVHGLDRQLLMRDGKVPASAIVLSHDQELDVLAESCPEALPAAVVAGDICLDRMRASLPFREHYRRALGVEPGETLVTISSTWTAESTFHQRPELYRELPRSGKVAAVLHPNIWAAHGEWQVRSWLAGSEVMIIPPEEGWRATVIASDVVVGDFGSTTQYAAAVGTRVLLATCPEVRDGSLAHALRRVVPMFAGDIAEAVAVPGFADLISSRLDQAGAILRATMYRLLGIQEPAHAVPVAPCSLTTA
ncbi:hypothetical protein [Lentzea flava]|uniref:CDP-Glycerol:Poly(Glycerophosphate) glycerophosphotransferase n=1 Tax=Lentzea flava TaxID=103732 RepID=A0ABQ2UUZ4_9PSEU|nr:hypothetical protein [Lentzea flava]MCP2201420.1 hypothetical protein [Lentzea flava]GGU51184.1 hypothetical protein GCM10010178_50000 [Lentzea flava]